ncbi:MAG: 4-(cytidine 5'-diphospho)-2-C-methyl-D-erythritol kinase [Clostridia bacterium]|nr:4-(cytidine 5'-diphospho)-2-C-methyl-D-erythritol kinase [Clostridia bacterium]
MRSVKEFANAKINLYLSVSSKREDGFHGIDTVMHTVSLCDEVTITLAGTGKRTVRLSLDGGKWLPTDGKNIAYAAAMLFMERAELNAEIHIRLVKRIPVAAGLAGGSADAAAVLRGMNRLFNRPFTERVLLGLAAELGSDVPYCLLGGTALCTGRGEKITRLPDSLSLNTVIAVAGEYVSTPAAYSALDALYSDFDGSVPVNCGNSLDELLASVKSGSLKVSRLYNIFEAAVLPTCPGAAMIKDRLSALGARYVMMSGSGPSVFGIFDTAASAEAAAKALAGEGITAHAAYSVKK